MTAALVTVAPSSLLYDWSSSADETLYDDIGCDSDDEWDGNIEYDVFDEFNTSKEGRQSLTECTDPSSTNSFQQSSTSSAKLFTASDETCTNDRVSEEGGATAAFKILSSKKIGGQDLQSIILEWKGVLRTVSPDYMPPDHILESLLLQRLQPVTSIAPMLNAYEHNPKGHNVGTLIVGSLLTTAGVTTTAKASIIENLSMHQVGIWKPTNVHQSMSKMQKLSQSVRLQRIIAKKMLPASRSISSANVEVFYWITLTSCAKLPSK